MAKLIPPATLVAAKKAFVRTTAQAYATSLTASLLLSVIGLLEDGTNWRAVLIGVLVALLTPLLAGLVAFLQWIHKGVPEAYEGAAIAQNVSRTLGNQG